MGSLDSAMPDSATKGAKGAKGARGASSSDNSLFSFGESQPSAPAPLPAPPLPAPSPDFGTTPDFGGGLSSYGSDTSLRGGSLFDDAPALHPEAPTLHPEPVEGAPAPLPAPTLADPLAKSDATPTLGSDPTDRQTRAFNKRQEEANLKAARADSDAAWKFHQDKKAAEQKAASQRLQARRQAQAAERQQEAQSRKTHRARMQAQQAQAKQAQATQAQATQAQPGFLARKLGVTPVRSAPQPAPQPAIPRRPEETPIHVEQALAKSPPPLQSDPEDTWDGMAPPKPEEIRAIRDKPVAERTHADQRRLHWAEDYWTNEDIQTETTAFYKLNSEVGAPTGHATGHAPFGADSARSEDARINRQRADHAIKSLGPDADPDHVRMVEAHYGLLPKQESKDTLGGTDGTDTFGGGDGDDSLIGGSGHDDLSEGSEVPNDQTQPAPTPEDESYFDRKTYRQAIEEQRLASWLAGGGQRIADNLSEAYDQWDPKWSDLYEIPGSMLRSFSNDIKDAIENPEDPSKTLPLALEATGLGGAFSRLPKALPDGDVLGMSGGRGTFQGTKKTWTQPRAPRPGEWKAPDGDLDTGDMEVIDLLNQGGSRPGQPATGNRNPGGIHNPDGKGVAHADRKHVVTEEYLDHRIRTEKDTPTASTYINQDFANKATTIAIQKGLWDAKFKKGKGTIEWDLGKTVGYVKGSKTKFGSDGKEVNVPHGKAQPTSRIKVVFVQDPSKPFGVHIVTSYPILP
ncbi:RNase A-like domain-containing protein [Magnetospira sp. QH-2]|uniref:RNase A-like domain-containing protein n=1 Tax=Magnetospira sp. (strain QH-2) TaxID=1288970 RepID=UPI0003E8175A|nr:RNase A-like domain-containing protein [Magnetospira sp. QH-2]CCQ74762.1 protein of unknown function [Magnetospira sp. QH-2]